MPSVAQIIAWVDRYCPNQETDANKLIDLDMIHTEIYENIIRKLNKYSTFTDYTIADQYTYTLPSDCTPENIIKIEISSDVTGSIDDDTTWQEYEYADIGKDVESGYYWGKLTNTTYILIEDGVAIDTSNYEIRIYYYASPTALSTTSQIPDLDPMYHDLLKFKLAQMLASEGDVPDEVRANYWQMVYEERYNKMFESIKEKLEASPIEPQVFGSRW